jgi:hypothetical protein
MATAIDFEERNDFIGKPQAMTENQCYALPVCRMITYIPGPGDQDKAEPTPAHVSAWQLSEEEKAEVAKTGIVYLKVIGSTTYPLSLHGIKPIYPGDGGLADIVPTKEEIEKHKTKRPMKVVNEAAEVSKETFDSLKKA